MPLKPACALLFSLTLALPSVAETSLPLSLRLEGQDAVRRGLQWLITQQKDEGYWSSPDWPALTGLSLWAISMSEARTNAPVDKAVAWLKDLAHPNGAIYREPSQAVPGGGKPNYNTAICMVALHLTGREDVRPLVLKARRFVAGSQHLGGDVYHGGFGYDAATERAYADLSNTYIALEGLALTESAEDLREGGEAAKVDKTAAAQFVSSIQNRKESNPAEWVASDPANEGGFAYHPKESKAGTITGEDGKVYFRSFGSMTYAGMLSLIYSDVDRNDPRVRSAFAWAARHWTVDENPGMGQQGYYYFANVLTKALAAYGQEEIPQADGASVRWREALVKKLVGLQKIDEDGLGYWRNDENRFWENDPVLVSAYTLIALQLALSE